jgi:hypothetical protein
MEGCLKERGYEVAGWSKSLNKAIITQKPASAD